MQKSIISLIVFSLLISGVMLASAANYFDVTETKTVEKDGKLQEIEVSDDQKTIKKEWTETRSKKFQIEDHMRRLENYKENINRMVKEHNKVVDELSEAKSALNLSIEVPVKLKQVK